MARIILLAVALLTAVWAADQFDGHALLDSDGWTAPQVDGGNGLDPDGATTDGTAAPVWTPTARPLSGGQGSVKYPY